MLDSFAQIAAEGFISILEKKKIDLKTYAMRVRIETNYFNAHHLNIYMTIDPDTEKEQVFFAVNSSDIFSYFESVGDQEKNANNLDRIELKINECVSNRLSIPEKTTPDFGQDLDCTRILSTMQVKPGNAPLYYQLESRASEYSSFFYEHDYYLQSLRYWNVERIKRKSIAKIPLDLSFSMERRSSRLNDFPDSFHRYCSKRLAHCISLFQKDIEILPGVFKNREGEVISRDFVAILLPEYSLFSQSASSFTKEEKINYLGEEYTEYSFDEFVMDGAKLRLISPENNFFVCTEYSHFIYCTEFAKKLLEKAFGKEGPAFIKAPVDVKVR